MLDDFNNLIAAIITGVVNNPMYYIGCVFAFFAFLGIIRFLWGMLDYLSALGHADEQSHGGSNMYHGVLFTTGIYVMWEIFQFVVDFFFGI
ncbi:MAG: hypothetical protein JWO43_5 [Candidatus Adlerbacteria bacterium]|nr:hypothetical protein [Candidatus Adlerbacteria bacterium]